MHKGENRRLPLTSVAHAPLRELISGQLRELIVSGQLHAGERLIEVDIADELGTSRVPVREALLDLAKDGWVDLRARHGARVHVPTQREVDEAFQVRIALEAESSRLAAVKASAQDGERLGLIVRRGVRLVELGDHAGVAATNSEFHATIAELAGNELLSTMLHRLDQRVRWYVSRVTADRGMDSWVEHAHIARAISEGDALGAQEELRRHIENTRSLYEEKFRLAELDADELLDVGGRS